MDVSTRAFQQNFLSVRGAVGEGVRIIPMVKANAYGLGMAEAIEALEPMEPWGYGVAAVEEGIRIRELGIPRPVLVLSPVPPGSYRDAVEADLSVCVSDTGALECLRAAALPAGRQGGFHLEVDTGMGRAGFAWDLVEAWGPGVATLLGEPLRWDGVFTHFHSADSVGDATATQWARLQDAVAQLPPMPKKAILHACNSPGALRRGPPPRRSVPHRWLDPERRSQRCTLRRGCRRPPPGPPPPGTRSRAHGPGPGPSWQEPEPLQYPPSVVQILGALGVRSVRTS